MYILGYNKYWSFDAKERLKSASTIEHPTLLLVKRYIFFDNWVIELLFQQIWLEITDLIYRLNLETNGESRARETNKHNRK